MDNQPTFNIGFIGDVGNGKTSLVSAITSTNTRRYKKEQEQGGTRKLGYANAKIFKCDKCPEPLCYTSGSGETIEINCENCNDKTKLIRHFSIVDCPGHDSLMATMLNGTSVMDFTILVESVSNSVFPGKQTKEHLKITEISKIPNICVCLNKIDVYKKEDTIERMKLLKKYLAETTCKDNDIIPISANSKINYKYILQDIVDKTKNFNLEESEENICKMFGVRSFNINKQYSDYKDIKGGVIGGSISYGKLNKGDEITIYPGHIISADKQCCPIKTKVLEMLSEKNQLDTAHSGGLIAVQTEIDSFFTSQDKLIGSCIIKGEPKIKVFHSIRILTEIFNEKYPVNTGDKIYVNCNSKNIICNVEKMNKKKTKMELTGTYPICAEIGDKINISIMNGNTKCLAMTGEIVEGDEFEIIDIDTFLSKKFNM